MSAQLLQLPRLLQVDANGKPLSGAKLYVYSAGTSTPLTVYQDADLSTAHPSPILANTNGTFAPVYIDRTTGDLKINITTSADVQVTGYPLDDIPAESLTAAIVGAALYPKTATETAASVTPSDYAYPPLDMRRYGIKEDGVDNTDAVQAVYDMVKASGGTLVFPKGDWAFYLDISGTKNAPVTIEGNGSVFRPYTDSPTNSAVIFADNSADDFSSTSVIFRRCTFIARTYGSTSTGDLDYAVYHKYASSKFYDCRFEYGTTASFYALYGQYNEFWSCEFDSSAASNTSAGCILDSDAVTAASNEVNFNRCKFFANSNGLWLKGTLVTRIRDCTFQGQTGKLADSCASIVLDQDSTDSETADTIVDGCWFEANSGYHIYEVAAVKTRLISNNTFVSGGENEIYFTHCNDIVVLGHNDYDSTLTFSINHASASTDTTRLAWRGNNTNPTVSVAHNGSQYFDVSISGSFTWTMNTTAAPTGTCRYSINGDAVTLSLAADITDTAVDVSHPVLAGAPDILTPAHDAFVQAVTENVGSTAAGLLEITGSGTFELYASLAQGGFSSGTGGVLQQTFPPYRINT